MAGSSISKSKIRRSPEGRRRTSYFQRFVEPATKYKNHSAVDGVFTEQKSGKLRFHRVNAPTSDEVKEVARDIRPPPRTTAG